MSEDPRLQGQRFLVLGGCGFVGTNIVRTLLDRGVDACTVIDDLFTGLEANLPQDPRLTFIEGSVTDEALLARVLPEVDYAINCAAVNIIAAQTDPERDLRVNALGPLALCQVARSCPNLKKLLQVSSASVYGNPEVLPIVEHVRTRPMSNYAVSKLAGENYAMVHYLIHDVPVAVVRYSNVYGPYQHPQNPYAGVVAKFIASATRDGRVEIHGTGMQTRDFTFVQDTVDATLLAVLSPRAEGRIFNVATGYEVSIHTLAEKIFAALGKEPNIGFLDKRDVDNISRRCLNIEDLRTTLKWEPRYSLDRGLERTLAWFQSAAD